METAKQQWREFWLLCERVAAEIEAHTVSTAGDPFGGWPLEDIRRIGELASGLGQPDPIQVHRTPDYLYLQWPQSGWQSVFTFREQCDDPTCEVCEVSGACRPVAMGPQLVKRSAAVLRSWRRKAERELGADVPPTGDGYLEPGEAMRLVPLGDRGDAEVRRIFGKLLTAIEPARKRQRRQKNKVVNLVSLLAWRELVAELNSAAEDPADVGDFVDLVVRMRRKQLGL